MKFQKSNDIGKQFNSNNAKQMQLRSAEARKKNKSMRELLELELEKVITNKTGEKATKKEIASKRIANGMADGDVKMLELGLKILGDFTQKQEIEITNDQPIFNIVQKKDD